jgi:hypothetical protein
VNIPCWATLNGEREVVVWRIGAGKILLTQSENLRPEFALLKRQADLSGDPS